MMLKLRAPSVADVLVSADTHLRATAHTQRVRRTQGKAATPRHAAAAAAAALHLRTLDVYRCSILPVVTHQHLHALSSSYPIKQQILMYFTACILFDSHTPLFFSRCWRCGSRAGLCSCVSFQVERLFVNVLHGGKYVRI